MLEKRIRVSPSVSLKCYFPPWSRSNGCTLSRSYSNYSWTLECPVSDIQLQTFPCTERTMSFRQIKVDNFPAAINVYLSIFTWEQPVQTAQSPVPDKSWHRPLHPFSGKDTAHDKIDDSLINITRASRAVISGSDCAKEIRRGQPRLPLSMQVLGACLRVLALRILLNDFESFAEGTIPFDPPSPGPPVISVQSLPDWLGKGVLYVNISTRDRQCSTVQQNGMSCGDTGDRQNISK